MAMSTYADEDRTASDALRSRRGSLWLSVAAVAVAVAALAVAVRANGGESTPSVCDAVMNVESTLRTLPTTGSTSQSDANATARGLLMLERFSDVQAAANRSSDQRLQSLADQAAKAWQNAAAGASDQDRDYRTPLTQLRNGC